MRFEETNPNKEQLIKGFQAQFWFSFASATIGALIIALTLKIGRRGTHEIRDEHYSRKAQKELMVGQKLESQIESQSQSTTEQGEYGKSI